MARRGAVVTSAANTGNAIERLREAPDSPFGPGDAQRYYDALAAVDALYQAARRIEELRAEGADTAFDLTDWNDAQRALAAAVSRVEAAQ